MVNNVVPSKRDRIIFWMSASVSPSTLAVASSRKSNFGFASIALPRQINWRSPTLKLRPPSSMIPLISLKPRDAPRTELRASLTSLSVKSPKGSKHCFSVPGNKTGSCGMIVIPFCLPLTFARLIFAMSTPSNVIFPLSSSTKRNRAAATVLFPAPVLPTTPQRCPDLRVNDSPSKDKGRPGRYLRLTLSNVRSPLEGQEGSTGSGLYDSPSSWGISVIARTLSRDVMDASLSEMPCTKKLRLMVKFALHMINIAAIPGSSLSTSLNEATNATENRTEHDPSI
mmetsp:Transcript_27596/g.58964  ORF Transcript_27596/g.58964 Transcript_27596/m.58964 type:complete len:283 (-) Transcript_27596:2954-3802(-)